MGLSGHAKVMNFLLYLVGFLVLRALLKVFYPDEIVDVDSADLVNEILREQLLKGRASVTSSTGGLAKNLVNVKDVFSLKSRRNICNGNSGLDEIQHGHGGILLVARS